MTSERALTEWISSPTVLALAARANDLLPPRPEDVAPSETLNRLAQHLESRLRRGSYEPARAFIVFVPKNQLTTRPAGLLTLSDRIVFHAHIARIVPGLEGSLVDNSVGFGPGSPKVGRVWSAFETAPLETEAKYIVRADIANFYESLPHDRLIDELLRLTVPDAWADDLVYFLGRVMDRSRGLPQGVLASDAVASIFLDSLDRAMISSKWEYFRRRDDIRIGVDSYSAGRRAVAALETALRDLGLVLNEAKTLVMRRETYDRNLRDVSEAELRLREEVVTEKASTIEELETLSELEDFLLSRGLMSEPEAEEALWDLYHGAVTVEELIQRIRLKMEPSHHDLAARLLRETLRHAPGTEEALVAEVFSRRITSALAVLAVAEDPVVLPQIDSLLFKYPHLTEITAHYLQSLLRTSLRKRAISSVENFLTRKRFRHEWQEAWLLYVLLPVAANLSSEFMSYVESLADDDSKMLVRGYAIRLLARRGSLSRTVFASAWRTAPLPLRPDLIDAADHALRHEDWPTSYLDQLQGDPMKDIILSQT